MIFPGASQFAGAEKRPKPQPAPSRTAELNLRLFIITAMTFDEFLQGAEVLSVSGNPGVAGVEYDSRRVRPGTVFVAVKGETSDGNRFISQAIAAGGGARVAGFV